LRREECRFRILDFLDRQGKASFKEIVKEVKAARRTTNKSLEQVYENEWIKKEFGKRGEYYLSSEGKKEVERLRTLRDLFKRLEKEPLEQLSESSQYLKDFLDALTKSIRVDPKLDEEIRKQMAEKGLKLTGPILWLNSNERCIDPSSVKIIARIKVPKKGDG